VLILLSFIYTTGLSPHSVATILIAYQFFKETSYRNVKNNTYFNQKRILGLKPLFIRSKSAIQSAIIPGNENVKKLLNNFRKMGLISGNTTYCAARSRATCFVCIATIPQIK
jgi:8-amino-7-oxononanoate synthase